MTYASYDRDKEDTTTLRKNTTGITIMTTTLVVMLDDVIGGYTGHTWISRQNGL